MATEKLLYSSKAKETAPRSSEIKFNADGSISVELLATVNGIETRVGGYLLDKARLADRLSAAWKAKAFWKKLSLSKYAKSYDKTQKFAFVHCDTEGDYMPLGRCLNADLKRMGF